MEKPLNPFTTTFATTSIDGPWVTKAISIVAILGYGNYLCNNSIRGRISWVYYNLNAFYNYWLGLGGLHFQHPLKLLTK